MQEIHIRSEKVSDIPAIKNIICQAFNRENEAKLVSDLRDKGALTFSLVAEDKHTQELLGHLSFSLVSIEKEVEGSFRTWQALALTPVSVIPKCQNQGIGSALINFWFQEYADDFYNAVFLLSNSKFFHRFSFLNVSENHLTYGGANLNDAFQVREIKKDFLKKVSGIVYYHDVFDSLDPNDKNT